MAPSVGSGQVRCSFLLDIALSNQENHVMPIERRRSDLSKRLFGTRDACETGTEDSVRGEESRRRRLTGPCGIGRRYANTPARRYAWVVVLAAFLASLAQPLSQAAAPGNSLNRRLEAYLTLRLGVVTAHSICIAVRPTYRLRRDYIARSGSRLNRPIPRRKSS
jgi:hypothetical protein